MNGPLVLDGCRLRFARSGVEPTSTRQTCLGLMRMYVVAFVGDVCSARASAAINKIIGREAFAPIVSPPASLLDDTYDSAHVEGFIHFERNTIYLRLVSPYRPSCYVDIVAASARGMWSRVVDDYYRALSFLFRVTHAACFVANNVHSASPILLRDLDIASSPIADEPHRLHAKVETPVLCFLHIECDSVSSTTIPAAGPVLSSAGASGQHKILSRRDVSSTVVSQKRLETEYRAQLKQFRARKAAFTVDAHVCVLCLPPLGAPDAKEADVTAFTEAVLATTKFLDNTFVTLRKQSPEFPQGIDWYARAVEVAKVTLSRPDETAPVAHGIAQRPNSGREFARVRCFAALNAARNELRNYAAASSAHALMGLKPGAANAPRISKVQIESVLRTFRRGAFGPDKLRLERFLLEEAAAIQMGAPLVREINFDQENADDDDDDDTAEDKGSNESGSGAEVQEEQSASSAQSGSHSLAAPAAAADSSRQWSRHVATRESRPQTAPTSPPAGFRIAARPDARTAHHQPRPATFQQPHPNPSTTHGKHRGSRKQ